MNQKWIHFIWISAVMLLLAGCGKTVEEQITEGVASAEAVFETDVQAPTQEVGKINIYVPEGYIVEQGATEMNYIFSKGRESYILFVNTIEAEDSQLHYDNLKNDADLNIVKEQTFQFEDSFGFTAVIEHGEKEFELVVSSGGVKMTTISEDKKIDAKLVEMMHIVRSTKVLDSTNE